MVSEKLMVVFPGASISSDNNAGEHNKADKQRISVKAPVDLGV